MNYSLLNRDIEHEILPFMKHSGMSLLVWSPLHGGMLSGKYSRDAKPPSGTRAGNRGLYFPFFDEATGFDVVEKVKTIAKEQGAKPSQVAISWLANEGHIVLLGARSLEQFDENLGSLDVQLTPDQLKQLDDATKPKVIYPNWMIQRQGAGRDFEVIQPR